MDDKSAQYFGLVIAFVIPGMVGLYALSYLEPSLRGWFGLAATSSTTLGGFLFVILGSVGMGVFLSGVRWLLLEELVGLFPRAPVFAQERRTDEQHELAYRDIRAQHYMFYLFYGNLLVAIWLFGLSWFFWASPRPAWLEVFGAALALLLVTPVLILSARDTLRRFDQKATRLLGLVPSPHDRASCG